MLNLLLSVVLLLLSCSTDLTIASPSLATRLPNGNGVQSPCNPAELWPGVGHFNRAGGGQRNPFGLDFLAEGLKWTPDLCRKDSDGDGRSNGEELGDPDCVWREGSAPSRTDNITHPGICEPTGSEQCVKLNGDFKCPDQFNCSAIHQPGVRHMSLRLNRTAVPQKKTTYMCQAYRVGALVKEHMIAAVPVIDNPSVVSRMIIFGCLNSPNVNLNEPWECPGRTALCFSIMDVWLSGMRQGNCYRDNAGAPFGGQTGYAYVVLQLVWNNPSGVETWHDASGFELYFSPTRRHYDTGVMMYGQGKLDLPPRQPEIHRYAVSDRRSSQALLPATGYKLLWGVLAIRQYGTRGQVTLWRDGKKVRDLIPMHDYNDTPMVFEYAEPIDYLPGDEIRTDCYYSTVKTNRSVYWGESTKEETCFSFFQYYPHNRTQGMYGPTADLCSSLGKIDFCALTVRSLPSYVVDGCDLKPASLEYLVDKHYDQAELNCQSFYRYRCSDQCLAWYRTVKATEPCFNNDPLDYILLSFRLSMTYKAMVLAFYLDSCSERDQIDLLLDAKAEIEELKKQDTPDPTTPPATPSPERPENSGLLTFDTRLLVVSGCYLASLLLVAVGFGLLVSRLKKTMSSQARVRPST